jgi:peroxiredoxin/ribosomal protein L40E
VYRKTGGQPKPSISICPNCQQQKDPNSALCLNCNTRSCANGHILAPNAAVCSKCGWTDHQWKAPPKSHAGSTAFTPDAHDTGATMTSNGSRCQLCGSRLDPKSAYCPACGNLASTNLEFTSEEVSTPPPPRIQTPATPPPRVESYTVTQEVIGHKDKRRNYYCPRCQNKVDDPRSGRCPTCGYVGTMEYDIYQHQPQWASNQQPPYYNPPPSQQGPVQRTPQANTFSDESICPHCGAPNPADSRFCRTCGERYGTGRLSRQVRTMSTGEWSAEAASALPATLEPIYQGAGGGESSTIAVRGPKAKGAPPRDRQGKKVRVKEYGERKFPLGLLMAIMIVVALIIALGIFIISKQFHSETPPAVISSDTTPPVISQINIKPITDTSAEITWTTDEPATSRVDYCDPAGLCKWAEDNSLTKNHSVTVDGIDETVTYHLTIRSEDQQGNEATFERDQMFTGGTPTDTTAPSISAVLSSDVTDMGVLITWKTDEPATSQVQYGKTNSYGVSTTLDSNLVTDHSVLIVGLDADSLYYYRVVSQDDSGNENTYDSAGPFHTLTAITIGLSVGDRAPDFTLQDLSDNEISLSSLRGKKIVMINFWYTTCGPCVAEMKYIQGIYSSWSGNTPLQIIAVNIIDTAPAAQLFMESKGYTFPVAVDTNNSVENLYQVTSAPNTYFLDIQGIIKYKKEGDFASQSDIQTVLDSID